MQERIGKKSLKILFLSEMNQNIRNSDPEDNQNEVDRKPEPPLHKLNRERISLIDVGSREGNNCGDMIA